MPDLLTRILLRTARAKKKKTASEQTSEAEDWETCEIRIQTGGFDYLEQTIKRMVDELKQKGCLDEDFTFLTRAEQISAFEECVDRFLKTN